MGYIRAEEVLPPEVLETVQQYIEGAMLYIPKREQKHSAWGSASGAKEYLQRRNALIYSDYLSGVGIRALADQYCLSEKSIQRIIRESKLSCATERTGGTEHEP